MDANDIYKLAPNVRVMLGEAIRKDCLAMHKARIQALVKRKLLSRGNDKYYVPEQVIQAWNSYMTGEHRKHKAKP